MKLIVGEHVKQVAFQADIDAIKLLDAWLDAQGIKNRSSWLIEIIKEKSGVDLTGGRESWGGAGRGQIGNPKSKPKKS